MTNGFVKITSGQYTYYVVPELITGAFETVFTGCSEEKFSVYSSDANDDFFSKPHTFLFSPIMETDTLFTCDSIDEFVIIHIEGFSNPIYYDSVDIKLFKDGNDATSIRGLDVSGSSFGIWFQGQNTGHYIGTEDTGFSGFIDSIQIRTESPIYITVEQYGDIGEYVIGRFQGMARTSEFHFVPEYQMTGTFKVRRE